MGDRRVQRAGCSVRAEGILDVYRNNTLPGSAIRRLCVRRRGLSHRRRSAFGSGRRALGLARPRKRREFAFAVIAFLLVLLSQESESEGRGLYGRRLSYLAGPDLDRCQPPESDLGRRCQSPPLLFRSYSVAAGFATAGIRDFRSSNSSGADSSVTHIIKVKSLR